MRAQLIRIPDQENSQLFKAIYDSAVGNRVGIIRNDKVLLKTEEYLFLLNQVGQPRGGDMWQQINWQSQYHAYALQIRKEFDHIYIVP